MSVEHEVKLAFPDADAARRVITSTGARLSEARRLIADTLFDASDRSLSRSGRTLRIRRDGDRTFLTFKGPVQVGPVKSRQETETRVGSAADLEYIVQELGFQPFFRAEKYREEYDLGTAHLALDETPIGVFVEIEASPDVIQEIAAALGRTPADYRLESYQRLYSEWCQARGIAPGAMTF